MGPRHLLRPRLLHACGLVYPDTLGPGHLLRPRLLHACGLVSIELLDSSGFARLRRLHACGFVDTNTLHSRHLLCPRLLHACGLFHTNTLGPRHLLRPRLLHAGRLAQTGTLHSRGFFGPALLSGHACGTIALKLLLRLLKRTLRARGLNIAKLVHQACFGDALLYRLTATAEGPRLNSRRIAPCLLLTKLLDCVVLLPTHDGLHKRVHVLCGCGSIKLSCGVVTKLLGPAKFLKIRKGRYLRGLKIRKRRYLRGLKIRKRRCLRGLKIRKGRHLPCLKPRVGGYTRLPKLGRVKLPRLLLAQLAGKRPETAQGSLRLGKPCNRLTSNIANHTLRRT